MESTTTPPVTSATPKNTAPASNALMRAMASALAGMSLTPAHLSVLAIASACLVPAGLMMKGGSAGAFIALIGVLLRILCGVAATLVPNAARSSMKLRALHIEIGARASDIIIFAGIGLGSEVPGLGWFVAVMTMLPANIRLLARSLSQNYTSGAMKDTGFFSAQSVSLTIAAASLFVAAAAPEFVYMAALRIPLALTGLTAIGFATVRALSLLKALKSAALAMAQKQASPAV